MYGYRTIAGHCVDCMTWEEAMELALVFVIAGGAKQRVEGELIQHFNHDNIAGEHQYCWRVTTVKESDGNQGPKRKARSNGKSAR